MNELPEFRHGLVVGKFYPLHDGHMALIRHATTVCEKVTVEVICGSTESIPVPVRAQWVGTEHPTVRVAQRVDDSEIDFDSPTTWTHHTQVIRELLNEPVDAVFTSDDYLRADELAAALAKKRAEEAAAQYSHV